MANSVKASCGHYVWAFGAEGSIARKRCESQPCDTCSDRAIKSMFESAADRQRAVEAEILDVNSSANSM